MTDEELVSEILARCRERSESGETVDTDEIVRAHPDLAAELKALFDVLRVLDRAYAQRPGDTGGSSDGADRAGRRFGPYRLLAQIGSGGMGSVWRAVVEEKAGELEPGRVVALKFIHPHLLDVVSAHERFLREAEIGRAVVHDNVVRTFAVDSARHGGRERRFLVMEHVEGQTLRGLLLELERVPEELCRHIGREVAKGLAAIHAAGIVHRDVKPENVLITKDSVVKVMDLGVACLTDEAVRLSQSGAFVGSLPYAAPERLQGKGDDLDGRSDLHSLGLVLYELACGVNPYDADNLPQIVNHVLHSVPRRLGELNPQTSPFFEEVVHCLLEKDREKRFESAHVLAEILGVGEEHPRWKERARSLRLETRRPLRRIRIPRETAIYGRDAELSALRNLFAQAKGGEGRVVLIEGEAGIGKSRVVDELIGRLQLEGEDVNFLSGSYPPGGAATASGAFAAAYSAQFGEAGSGAYLTRTPLLAPAFDALLRGDMAPPGVETLTKDSLQTCFVHATRALAAERTTVVLVDDLHFAPEEGRALFAALALAVPGNRVLLVGTMRPGVPEAWASGVTRLEQTSRITLPRIGAKDLVRVLEDAFHSRDLAATLSAQIALKADGNPFFVFEIVRGLREGQFITQKDDGSWISTGAIDEIKVPSSVVDLVNARVSGLGQEERDVVDVACCWGFEFDPILVGDVVGLGRIPVLKLLSQIEQKHRLVRSAGPGFVFDHHQVQEALYQGLPELLRQEYHAALATALESRASARGVDPEALPGAVCLDLAEHFLRGARGPSAHRYLAAALAYLEGNYLNERAVALIDRALASAGLLEGRERSEILLRQAACLDSLGRRAAERAALDEARSIADASNDDALRARALGRLANHLCDVSRHAEAETAVRAALDYASGDRNSLTGLIRVLGKVFDHQGRYAEAQGQYERSLALARESGDRRAEATATGDLGIVFWYLGRFADAQARHERALALYREIGDRRGEGIAMGNLAADLHCLGRHAESQTHNERRLAIARETGNRRGEAIAFSGLGNTFLALGRFADARTQIERYHALAQELGDRRALAIAMNGLGVLSIALGRYTEAQAHYERCLALARAIEDVRWEGIAEGNLGVVSMTRGRTADARVQCERSLALAQEIGDEEGVALDLGSLGRLHLTLGDPVGARRYVEESLAVSRRLGSREGECHALAYLAATADEDGDAVKALRFAGESLALRRARGARGEMAESLAEIGDLKRKEGDSEGAKAALEESVSLFREQERKQSVALGLALLACLRGGDANAAEAAVADMPESDGSPRLPFLLWEATGKREHLAEAKRRLTHLVDHAPPECRGPMLANVRLHREVTAAKEQGL